MASERDISILIPSYRRPEMIRIAIASALATGAGEVVVSDDASGDNTVDAIRAFRDPRVRLIVQPRNLGLWPNHLALLSLASRPWIKFLQNDDRIAPGGLARLAEHATPQTSAVGALTLIEDKQSGRTYSHYQLSRPLRFDPGRYLRRLVLGNELGSPSDVLYRADVLDRSAAAWRIDVSADAICNVLAAARGEVVIVPPGPVLTGEHPGRDMNTQSFQLAFTRYCRTVKYLRQYSDPGIQRWARAYGFGETLLSLWTAAGMIRRGGRLYRGFASDWVGMIWQSASPALAADFPDVCRLFKKRIDYKLGRDWIIDAKSAAAPAIDTSRHRPGPPPRPAATHL